MTRADDVAAALERVRGRIRTAATEAGRDPAEITLVVVTKFFPASDVRVLADLGVTDVGENRFQEVRDKASSYDGLALHFIGSLQSNKAAAVAQLADVVQSVDRAKLLAPLGRGAHERGRVLDVTLQVDLDPEPKPGRGGVVPADVPALADAAAGTEGLRLRGLMAVAPRGADPAEAFDRLASVAADLRRDHPHATWLSAGMSGDLEQGVRAGATHVRVGSAVLGSRRSD